MRRTKMRKYKHARKKKRTYGKSALLLISLFTLFLVSVGVTSSFLKTQKGPLVNEFASSYVTSEVVEEFDNKVKSNVRIKNTGDIAAYIRSTVIVTWKDENGNVYPKMPVEGIDYTIEFSGNGWDMQTSDGYYYYSNSVAPNETTKPFIDRVTPVDEKTPEGYIFSVEILGDAIQSLPTKAVESSWGVTVTNGQISK
jgi:hypothetical protein